MTTSDYHKLYPQTFSEAVSEAHGAIMGWSAGRGEDPPRLTPVQREAIGKAFAVMFNAGVAVRTEDPAEKQWNQAVDWLLNSSYCGEPGAQAAFWMLAGGHCTRDEADRGYKDGVDLVEIQDRVEQAENVRTDQRRRVGR